MAKENRLLNPGTLTFGFLALFALIWALLPFLWPSDTAFDLNVHDIYLVVGSEFILMMIAISSSIIALLYLLINRLSKKNINRLLTVFHIIASLLGLCGMIILSRSGDQLALESTERRYFSYGDIVEPESSIDLMPIVATLLVVGVIGQLFFIINLFISIINWLIKR